MATLLPPYPRFIFAIFEPLSLLAGSYHALNSPEIYSSTQIPPSSSRSPPSTHLPTIQQQQQKPHDKLITHQLGNLYLLLSLIGIAILYTPYFSTSREVVKGANDKTRGRRRGLNVYEIALLQNLIRAYLLALACGDIGHLWVTYKVLGPTVYFDVAGWNLMTWGNVGVTTLLFVSRITYLLGWFGPDKFFEGVALDSRDASVSGSEAREDKR